MKYASDQSRILVADLSLMNRREIKNRIAFKIWTAVHRVEKYKIGAAVQILETIRFITFRDDTFTRGQSNMRRFIYERPATNWRVLSYVQGTSTITNFSFIDCIHKLNYIFN